MGSCEMGFCEIGFCEMGFCEMGFCEMGFCKMGFCEMGFCEMVFIDVSPSHMSDTIVIISFHDVHFLICMACSGLWFTGAVHPNMKTPYLVVFEL